MQIPVTRLHAQAQLPTYGSGGAAGADLHACIPQPLTLEPGQTALIPTGLAMQLPAGYAGFVYARSGLATKRGLAPANKVGVIDSDYRGEILVGLHNHGAAAQTIEPGERIAQIVIAPVVQADFLPVQALDETARGAGGFGSTGR